MRDLISNLKSVLHFASTLTATNAPSTGVDLKGFKGALIQCAIGTVTNIAASPQPSWTFALQESDDNSAFTDVATADVILSNGKNDGAIASGVFATIDAAAEDDAVYTIGYVGSKRYIKVNATAAATPGATPISVVMTLGANLIPVDDAA